MIFFISALFDFASEPNLKRDKEEERTRRHRLIGVIRRTRNKGKKDALKTQLAELKARR